MEPFCTVFAISCESIFLKIRKERKGREGRKEGRKGGRKGGRKEGRAGHLLRKNA